MKILDSLSIRRRVIATIMLTGGLPMLFACIALITKDHITFNHSKRQDLSTLALVVGLNSEGALAFNDPVTAEVNLSAFSAISSVLSASIYDRNGKLFASYSKEGNADAFPIPETFDRCDVKDDDNIRICRKIFSDGQFIGSVFIRYDVQAMRKGMLQSTGIVFSIMLVAFLAAFLLSQKFQRVITDPVLNLAEMTKTISRKKDYSARAPRCGMKEISTLVDGFNNMLGEIQIRDQELKCHKEHLEDIVEKRTGELLKANEELVRAKEAAEASNRAKSEFLANMSHEIRTPMNAVLGFADLLYSMIEDPRQKSYIESIRSSGKSLLMLINDILDLSKIEARRMELQYEPVNPKSIFNEIHQLFLLKIQEKGLEFIIDIDPEIPDSLILEEVRLRQILFNLIGNAVKFTEYGSIRLAAKKRYKTEDQSALDLVISVEDTGIGIPGESVSKIFEAFKQMDGQSTKKYGGTGLGLAITKRLVEMMGGEISLESEVGKGTRFEIILHDVAVSSVPAKSKNDKVSRYERIIFEKAGVLIVDDIPSNRKLVEAFLIDSNIRTMEADNGENAVLTAERNHPDVILMDIRMPVMDGFEATKRIKEIPALQHTKIIALTASGMKTDREKIERSGFDGYLSKPVRKGALFRELAKYIPHSFPEEKKEIPVEQSDWRLPDNVIENLPEIVYRLENEMLKEWEISGKTGFFDDIGKFARKVSDFGREEELPMLVQFGKELECQAGSFDIENMNQTLKQFPMIVERIKHLGKTQGDV